MLIVNSEFDFIVKNIKSVKALIESYSRAKERIPVWFSTQLKRKIDQKRKQLPDNGNIWKVDNCKEEVTLTTDQYYSDIHGYGAYYGIECISLENLTAEYPENGPLIYLGYSRPERAPRGMATSINTWEQSLINETNRNAPALANRFHVHPYDTYLVTLYLYGILNAETLSENPEKAIENTVATMIEFVMDTFHLLVPIPD